MIAYIEGRISKKYEDSLVVVTNGGIGFQVFVPTTVLSRAGGIGDEVFLNTYMQVREDGMFLYGFTEDEELELFKELITVSGVGPKVALALLSALSPNDILIAILSGDAKTLSMAQGVGKKVAEKIILFLKEKAGKLSDGFGAGKGYAEYNNQGNKDVIMEAAQALNALGFSMTDAMKAVNSVNAGENTTVEEIVKLALKKVN
ncbi:MAG: Holliday junction branch migration protein RuvA [Lachnospiraceae bacterium]|nr:Holliday junction branch migration protein RuvA [Lachnospiraceae bacterium]